MHFLDIQNGHAAEGDAGNGQNRSTTSYGTEGQ